MSDNSHTKNYRTYNPDNFNLVPMLCVGTEPSRLRSSSFALCTFVPLLSFLSTGASTKNSRQELLALTPLHRLIITKGLRRHDAYSQISLNVMIAPFLPTGRLRSRRFHYVLGSPIILKVGVVGSFSEIVVNYLTSTRMIKYLAFDKNLPNTKSFKGYFCSFLFRTFFTSSLPCS